MWVEVGGGVSGASRPTGGMERGRVFLTGGEEIAPDSALKLVNKGLMEVVGVDAEGNISVRPTPAFRNAVKTGQNDLVSVLHYRM